MDVSSTLAADLRLLANALDPPRVDLEQRLRDLIADIRMIDSTYLGLAITIVNAGLPYMVVALDGPRSTVAASARLPLDLLCDVEAGSTLVFYASRPAAFEAFAADVTLALGLPRSAVTVDADLMPPADGSSSALATARTMDQAIGVLIDRGRTLEEATEELQRRAELGEVSAAVIAAEIVTSTTDGEDD